MPDKQTPISDESKPTVSIGELVKTPLADITDAQKTEGPKTPKVASQATPTREISLRKSLDLDNLAKEKSINQSEIDHRQLLWLRWTLSLSGLSIAVGWQTAILCIVWQQGWGMISITTPVLMALVTTTTVNVFGILIIVMKFVFPQTDPRNKKPKSKT